MSRASRGSASAKVGSTALSYHIDDWRRFSKFITGRSPRTGCELWNGAVNNKGYGVFSVTKPARKLVLAHRWIFSAFKGPIAHGFYVLHKCDTPACVRVDHLFLGTHMDNMKDAARKGRLHLQRSPWVAEGHPRAVLTTKLARDIKRRLARGESQASVHRTLGVSRGIVSNVATGRSWRHA